MQETLDRSTLGQSDKALLEKLLLKSPSELGRGEVAIIRARRAYLTAIERGIFKEILEEEIEEVEVESEEEDKNERGAISEEVEAQKPARKTKKK